MLTDEIIAAFGEWLESEEKSRNTVEKYLRDVRAFAVRCEGREICKQTVIDYKQGLIDSNYAVRSINSMLASVNCLLGWLGLPELCVKSLRVQNQVFCPEERELTKAEYERLCRTAKRRNNEGLYLILQTICGTGIRVSELGFITVEAVQSGQATVSLKGKTRTVIIVSELREKLLRYIAKRKLVTGTVFTSKNGMPISRTSVWRMMKSLCREAAVDPAKVFPHNLRHLFARVFYSLEKDIAKLADILGHSSINTTRIYIATTVSEHRKFMENMRLII